MLSKYNHALANGSGSCLYLRDKFKVFVLKN